MRSVALKKIISTNSIARIDKIKVMNKSDFKYLWKYNNSVNPATYIRLGKAC